MKNNVAVSVIVPIYRVEKFIEKCARSLFEQTMKEGIEFVFVDDATPDRSIEILRKIINEYPDRKDQIQIICQDHNCGLVFARKTGVLHSNADYIIHCDSDDWMEPNMVEELYKEAVNSNAEITGCDLFENFSSTEVIQRQDFLSHRDDAIKSMFDGSKLKAYLCIRMCKREFYIKYGMNTPNGITLYEDFYTSFYLHYYASIVAYVPKPLYHYRQQSSSAMTKKINLNSWESANRVIDLISNDLMALGRYEVFSESIWRRKMELSMFLILKRDLYHPDYWRKLNLKGDISRFPIYKRLSVWLITKRFDSLNLFYITCLRNFQRALKLLLRR